MPPLAQTKKMTKKIVTSQALIDKRIDFYLTKSHYRKDSSASEADDTPSSTLRSQHEETKIALHKAQQQIELILTERSTLSQTLSYLQNQITNLQNQITNLNLLYHKLNNRMDGLEDQVSMYITDLRDDLLSTSNTPFLPL